MLDIKSVDLKKERQQALIIPACKDAAIHGDKTINALIKKAKALKEFSGDKDDELVLYDPSGIKAKRVILAGLGKRAEIDAEALRVLSGRCVKRCVAAKLTSAVLAAPSSQKIEMGASQLAAAMLEGACLVNHFFDKYKADKKQRPLKSITLMPDRLAPAGLEGLAARIETVCRGTILARDWISTPANDKRPEQFARSIVKTAKKEKLKTTVLDAKMLKQKNFGAILAVAAGSQSKPSLVLLEYLPEKTKKTVALVGKGVTFDTGGINLKPTGAIETMKQDMSGAAAVAATLVTASRLKLPINIVGAIPVVENMPSGTAIRPGDIIKSYAGQTVEIGNTDAEGRLILIDAMAYVIEKYSPLALIDLATLTGACAVALGEKIAGLFSKDERLRDTIVASGNRTFERCWPMPLPEDYKPLLKSEFADINNISSSRYGGAVTAALFLSEFVGDTPWAHLDIAGPAYIKKEEPYCRPGGTGFGVRLLCDVLETLQKDKSFYK
jgi:leucyl aminopeptidase